MSAVGIAVGIGVVVLVLVVLACCGFLVYKYFWKNKKQKKKEENGMNGKLEQSAGKSPPTSFVNLQHVNLGFDKASEQGSFDNDPPTDSSYNSTHESPNTSYTYYHSQSDSTHTSDSEYGRDHTLSSSTEHSRKSIRFADNLPTLSGDQPPEDGRMKIGRATVTVIPPPPPRGRKALPPIEIPKSKVKQAQKAGYSLSGTNPRVSMNPMPSGRVVHRKHSSGSSRTSPHRRSGRSSSRSPNRSSGRSPHRNSGRRSRSDSANRHSGSSFDSNATSPQVSQPAPEFPLLNGINKQAHDYSSGMHPAMTGDKPKTQAEHYTHVVAGNSSIVPQPTGESQGLERNTQHRRSRSRKRRPRGDGRSSEDNSLSESGSQDIVPAVCSNVDSPPTLQMVAPGGKQPPASHASPLAQSSPQTQRYRKTPDTNLDRYDMNTPQQSFDSHSGELRPRMPYDYYPPQSPGDTLGNGKQSGKTPRDTTSYQPNTYKQQTKSRKSATTPRSGPNGEKISDPDSNYFSGSSGDRLDSDISPQHGGQGGRLVFQGVANAAFQSDNTTHPSAQPEPIKPKKRRRKSQNRGKNTAGDFAGVHVQSNGPHHAKSAQSTYRNPALGYSNDSMVYIDEATDTDMYTISSKKAVKARSAIALQGGKSGETEL